MILHVVMCSFIVRKHHNNVIGVFYWPCAMHSKRWRAHSRNMAFFNGSLGTPYLLPHCVACMHRCEHLFQLLRHCYT